MMILSSVLLAGDMTTLSSFLVLYGVSIQIFASFIPCNTLEFLGGGAGFYY